MRKILSILILLLFHAYFCNAQQQDGKENQKIEAVRMAYITNQLNLTPEEAQKFWPVYNKYFNEVKKTKQENPNDIVAFQEKLVDIRKKYKPDFKQVLGSDERVNKVYAIDTEFHKLLKNELKNRQTNGQSAQMIQGFR